MPYSKSLEIFKLVLLSPLQLDNTQNWPRLSIKFVLALAKSGLSIYKLVLRINTSKTSVVKQLSYLFMWVIWRKNFPLKVQKTLVMPHFLSLKKKGFLV